MIPRFGLHVVLLYFIVSSITPELLVSEYDREKYFSLNNSF